MSKDYCDNECSQCGTECDNILCHFCYDEFKKIKEIITKFPRKIHLRKDIGDSIVALLKAGIIGKRLDWLAGLTTMKKNIMEILKEKKFIEGPGTMNEFLGYDEHFIPQYNPEKTKALYFKKPIDLLELLEIVEQLLGQKTLKLGNFLGITNSIINYLSLDQPFACMNKKGTMESCIKF